MNCENYAKADADARADLNRLMTAACAHNSLSFLKTKQCECACCVTMTRYFVVETALAAAVGHWCETGDRGPLDLLRAVADEVGTYVAKFADARENPSG